MESLTTTPPRAFIRLFFPSWRPVVFWIAALVVTIPLYWAEDSLIHFLWHLGYGAAAGLMAVALVALIMKQPPNWPAWWALGGYLYMIIPDGIWLAPVLVGGDPIEHSPWMNLFLGHPALDEWRYTSLLLLPVKVLSVFAVYLTWRRTCREHGL